MPNGYYGPREEWLEMEKPLRTVDPLLATFAEQHGMEIVKNYHNRPSRTLKWGQTMRRKMSIYLADEEKFLFDFGIMAAQDKGGRRFWRREVLERHLSSGRIQEVLPGLLEEGRTRLEMWSGEDLEYAGDITEL